MQMKKSPDSFLITTMYLRRQSPLLLPVKTPTAARAVFACAVLRSTYAPFFENKKDVLTKKRAISSLFWLEIALFWCGRQELNTY